MTGEKVALQLRELFLVLNDSLYEADTKLKEAQAYKQFKDDIAELLSKYKPTKEQERTINININFE